MFEETCFSCGNPTAGSLYCSDACERKDKEPVPPSETHHGSSMTPGGRPLHSPPPFASPLFGPVPALVPSGRSNRANSSSSSPTTSSPNTSPSPWAESQNVVNGSPPPTLHLPPQAYPSSPRTHVPADPVKIPVSSSFVGSVDGLREGGGETLKFTRRPGPTNHPTSPLALFPVGRQHARTSSSAYGSVSSSLGLTSLDARAAQGSVRSDRPAGFIAQGGPRIKSDSSVVGRRTHGSDGRPTSDDDHHSDEREHQGFAHLHHTQSAFARAPPFHHDFPPPPLPLSPRGVVAPQPRPSPTRRRSIPMHHSSGSPTTNALASSSQQTVAPQPPPPRSSPLSPVSSAHVFPPSAVGRGRAQRSDSNDERASRSRSRIVGGRSATRSRTRDADDRPRRGSSRSAIDDEPRRGRRGSSKRSEDSSSDVGDESGGDRETSRGRRDEAASRGRGAGAGRGSDAAAPPPRPHIGPSADYVPVFERTPEHRARSLSKSPDSLANGGGATIRGRRPTVVERPPTALTVLNGGGTLRTEPNSKSRSSDRMARDASATAQDGPVDDLRGRFQGVKVIAS